MIKSLTERKYLATLTSSRKQLQSIETMEKSAKIPEHQSVYERLRDMILLGKFAPGQPLTIMGLAESLSVGMTPVREALRRLTAENALTTLGNRRIVVPQLSLKDIQDIYYLRFEIESELAGRAAGKIEKPQIAALIEIDAAIDRALDRGDIDAYLEYNNQFHFNIYAIAEAPVLLHATRSLWVQAGPGLRVVCGRYGTANLPDKHSELLQALSAADCKGAARAMRDDLQQSLTLISTPAAQKNMIKSVEEPA